MSQLAIRRLLQGAACCGVAVAALVAMAVPAVALPAPRPSPQSGTPPTMYVGGMSSTGVAPGNERIFTNLLAEALANKYGCADVLSSNDIGALLGLAKDQQTLGTPEEQQVQLQDIADAMGRSGTLVFGNVSRMGGTYSVNLKVLDGRTGTIIDNKMVTGQGGDDSALIDMIKDAVSQLDVPVCDVRWVGTITITEKTTSSVNKTEKTAPMLAVGTRNPQREEQSSIQSMHEVKAKVNSKPASAAGPGTLRASISRTASSEISNVVDTSQEVNCTRKRPAWANPEWQGWHAKKDDRMSGSGGDTVQGKVSVAIGGDGRYTITMTAPKITVKTTTSSSSDSPITPCEGSSSTMWSDNFDSELQPETYTFEGQTDPKDPRSLSGGSSTSTPVAGGTMTITKNWSLTRQDPPKR